MKFEIGFGGQTFDPRDLLKDDEPDDDAAAWIVQFAAPLAPDQIKALRAEHGLALVDFIPESAYIERIPAEAALALREHELVRTVVAYGADLKVSRTVDAVRRNRKDDDDVAVGMTATLFDDADLAGAAASVQQLGAVDVHPFDDRPRGGSAVVRFGVRDFGLLRRVARLEGVRWIEPVLEMADDSPGTPPQPAIASFGLIWDEGVHGEGQVIGVMDAGPFDMKHCFFEDAAVDEPGPSHRKVIALRNKVGSRPGPHATFVAACAAGDESTAPGAHPRRGGAWAAKLVGSNRRDVSTGKSALRAELDAAAAAGATIHSNSWHFLPPEGSDPHALLPYDGPCAEMDSFMWLNEDHLILCSAGNSRETQGPPGIAKNVLCVAASKQEVIALGDGSPGPTLDGRRRPDLMMIGCGVITADVGSGCEVAPRDDCASSYATPYAAAAAALVRQYLMEGRHPTGKRRPEHSITPTGALLKAVLLNATLPPQDRSAHPSDAMGWGLVDLPHVLFCDPSRRRMHFFDVRHADGVNSGDVVAYPVTVVDGAEPLKVSLVWTDRPGTIGADNPVVNNLDLEVTSPRGTASSATRLRTACPCRAVATPIPATTWRWFSSKTRSRERGP